MKLLINAPFHTRARVGISRYIRNLTDSISRLADTTVMTPHPEVLAGTAFRTMRIPEWTSTRPGRLIWTAGRTHWRGPHEFDVVITPLPVAPLSSDIPTVAVVHDLTPLVLPQLHSSHLKTAFWLSLQTLRRADAVVTVSENTRRDLAKLHLLPDCRVRVIPEGPGLETVKRTSGVAVDLDPFLLYVGGHAPHKNVSRLVRAFAVANVPASVRLVIVGWGSQRYVDATRRAVEQAGLTDRVVLMHDLGDGLLSALYADCLALIYPSLYEGFGLPVLEALAHGAPVGCSRASSLPEVCGDAALYFDPLSVGEIANTIALLVGSNEVTGRLRALARKRARMFGWGRTAREFVDLATDLTRSPGMATDSAPSLH